MSKSYRCLLGKKLMLTGIISCLHLFGCMAADALKLPSMFSDNMILQQEKRINIWGAGEPDSVVTVKLIKASDSSLQRETSTTLDSTGKWLASLDKMGGSFEEYTIVITSGETSLSVKHVLFGEVWVNGGQSNSQLELQYATDRKEALATANNPNLRIFYQGTPSGKSFICEKAFDVIDGKWKKGDSAGNAATCSAVAYSFARKIYDCLNKGGRQVPVGIIEANHGGSSIISWMSDAALASSPKFAALAMDRARVRDEMVANLPVVEESVRLWAAAARENARMERPVMPFPVDISPIRPFYGSFVQNLMNRRGSMFYNSMIHSMAGYGVKGALWNQGEAETGNERTGLYDDLMAAMVADWRKSWGDEFPFYYVQMPAIKGRSGLLEMWPAQVRALTKIPKSGMIVCNDISEPERGEGGIHPRDKKNVGERLARLAFVRTYGVKGMVDASPMMESVARDGNRVVVTFSTPGEGLKTRDGKPADSWEIAGADGKFVPATAEILGAKVTVSAAGVTVPAAVRLGWKSDSNCNLVNSAGLPAMPFSSAVSGANKPENRSR